MLTLAERNLKVRLDSNKSNFEKANKPCIHCGDSLIRMNNNVLVGTKDGPFTGLCMKNPGKFAIHEQAQ